MNIKINNLSYTFQGHVALNKINLVLYPGQVTYILGPNGSGKSTLVNCISGIYSNYTGEVKIPGGFKMGALLDEPFIYRSLKVRDNIKIFLRYNGIEHNAYHDMLNQYLEIEELLSRPFYKLSGGQKQRVLLFISLINDPDVILLDEPFNSLDPFYAEKLIAMITQLKYSGRMVLINDHIISHTLRLADQVAFLIKHELVWTMPVEVLSEGLYFHFNPKLKGYKESYRPFSDCIRTSPANGQGASRRIEDLTDLYTTAIEYGRPPVI